MSIINWIAIFTMAILIFGYVKYMKKSYVKAEGADMLKSDIGIIGMILMAALLVRFIGAIAYRGHSSDMGCFLGWANRVFEEGFSNFYSTESFTDYPPGYMYILYIIGAIKSFFHMEYDSSLTILLTKMPAILCDLATGWLIYHVAKKRLSEKTSLFCACAYLFHPIIILNSSIWGQVDSVFTLAVAAMCYFVTEKQLPKAYFAFAIGILIKPQTLIFTPVLIYGIIDQVFLGGIDKKNFQRQLLWGLGAIASMFLLAVPFGLPTVIKQYVDTIVSYPYATINGYNLWTFFGLNWVSQDGVFLFLKYSQWGTLFIVLIVSVATYLSFRKKKDKSKYYFLGAFIVIGMFMLSVRMHERYMFPALALLLLAFVYRPRKEIYIFYVLFSVVHFYNTAHVLAKYDPSNFNSKALVPIVIAGFMVLIFLLFIFWVFKYYTKDISEVEQEEEMSFIPKENKTANIFKPVETIEATKRDIPKWKRLDFILLFAIMIVYSIFALRDLGEQKAPITGWETDTEGEQIILDMGSLVDMKQISYYLGNYERRTFKVEVSESMEGPWNLVNEALEMVSVFTWGETELNTFGQYLRLTSTSDQCVLLEMAVLDNNGNVIQPVNQSDYPELFDEQALRPERATFREGTYFDEIYHARTAYEFVQGDLRTYEWTHPPLGKIFISIGIRLFGMNPFGWRIIGTLFGILMIPFMYAFGKRLFKETWITTILTILFSFDFMHFTQTRIATIDVFVTFFIILMYYFMYRYTQMSFYDTKLTKTWIPLALCGISMGLGVASKWTGAYAGIGLAIIFFWTLYKRYQEYEYAKSTPGGVTNGITHNEVIKHFKEYTIKTLLFCVIFFVIIPFIIYLLSYLPFSDSTGNGLFKMMSDNQTAMLRYHAQVDATHPYSSTWYQWPVIYRPMWYYSGHVTDTISEGISAFGNPLVWWAGIPAFFYMLYLIYKEKDKKAGFLAVAYLAQYIPWFFVTRVVFIYHYFPSVPFVAIMVTYSIYRIVKKRPKLKKAAFVYAALAVILFLMFYPVLSGQPVDKHYVFQFLRWFKSWVLVT